MLGQEAGSPRAAPRRARGEPLLAGAGRGGLRVLAADVLLPPVPSDGRQGVLLVRGHAERFFFAVTIQVSSYRKQIDFGCESVGC